MSETIFELSREGRHGITLPKSDVPSVQVEDSLKRQDKAPLPELSELDVVRHFTRLSNKNFSIDSHFYPLGSCTMKYNPKMAERIGALEGFTMLHPHHITNGNTHAMQGALEVVETLQHKLCEITGMDAFSMTPQAGAHGEMLGLMMIGKYHEKKGNTKKYVIVPDSSHGTNPATAAMVDYEVITVKSDANGEMDLDAYTAAMNDEVAAVMMTVPNTLGLFNPRVKEMCDIAHAHDALMYYDGANLNAILGVVRPGDIGFDVVHLNLHKTFATPHGGGGPGAGPVGVKAHLEEFLPDLQVGKNKTGYHLTPPDANTLGKIAPFFGNYLVLVKALAYMCVLGKEGLENASKKAVLNANYVLHCLKPYLDYAFGDKRCMHECVLSAETLAKKGVKAMDIAKYLIDHGFHAPTVYFPLIVKEAIMIEPTETESKETLDLFCEAVKAACALAKTDPHAFEAFPKTLPISRPDETRAARQLDIRFIP